MLTLSVFVHCISLFQILTKSGKISSILQSIIPHTEMKAKILVLTQIAAITSLFVSLFALILQVPFVSCLLQAIISNSSSTLAHLTNASTPVTKVGLYTYILLQVSVFKTESAVLALNHRNQVFIVMLPFLVHHHLRIISLIPQFLQVVL